MIAKYTQQIHLRLFQFSRDFMVISKASDVVSNYKEELEAITPLDAIKVMTWLAQSDYDINTISNKSDKLTSLFYKPLKQYYKPYPDGHFLLPYETENLVLLRLMEETRPLLGKILKSRDICLLPELQKLICGIKSHSRHFVSVEVHIFPLIERVLPQYAAYVRLESLFNNEFKQMLREIEHQLILENCNLEEINKQLGRLYFRLSLRLYRENLMLFPLCCQFIHERFYKLVLLKGE